MSVSSVSAGVSTDACAIPDEGEFQGIEDIDSDDVTVKTGVIAKTLLSSPEARKELVRTLNKVSHIHSVWRSLKLSEEKRDDPSMLKIPEIIIHSVWRSPKLSEEKRDDLSMLKIPEIIREILDKKCYSIPIEDTLARLTLTLHDELQSLKNALEPSDSRENQKIKDLIQEMTLCIQHIKNNVNKLGIPTETFLLLIDLWHSMPKLCYSLNLDQSNSSEESGSFNQHQGACKPLSSLLPAVDRLKAIEGDMQDSAHYIAEILEKLADAETVKEAIAILNEYGGPAAVLKNTETLGIKQLLGVIFDLLLFANAFPFPEAENWNSLYVLFAYAILLRKTRQIKREIEVDPCTRIPNVAGVNVILKKMMGVVFIESFVALSVLLLGIWSENGFALWKRSKPGIPRFEINEAKMLTRMALVPVVVILIYEIGITFFLSCQEQTALVGSDRVRNSGAFYKKNLML